MKTLRGLLAVLAITVPSFATAQLSIKPPSPQEQEAVHLTAPGTQIGQYDPFKTLVSMTANVITVSIQSLAISSGTVVPDLDVVLGRFPAGSYDVSVVKRSEEGGGSVAVGAAHFAVAAHDTRTTAPIYDYSDLWWTPSESGWGLDLTQHVSNNIFAAWFVYGNDGKPTWYVLPNGTWTNSFTYTGAVYKTTGPSFGASSFNPSQVVVSTAGTATLTFTDYSHAVFSYSVDGVTGSKNIEREPF